MVFSRRDLSVRVSRAGVSTDSLSRAARESSREGASWLRLRSSVASVESLAEMRSQRGGRSGSVFRFTLTKCSSLRCFKCWQLEVRVRKSRLNVSFVS